MKIDSKMGTGILIGMVLGLHFHASLIGYLPLMLVIVAAFLLKTIRS